MRPHSLQLLRQHADLRWLVLGTFATQADLLGVPGAVTIGAMLSSAVAIVIAVRAPANPNAGAIITPIGDGS